MREEACHHTESINSNAYAGMVKNTCRGMWKLLATSCDQPLRKSEMMQHGGGVKVRMSSSSRTPIVSSLRLCMYAKLSFACPAGEANSESFTRARKLMPVPFLHFPSSFS